MLTAPANPGSSLGAERRAQKLCRQIINNRFTISGGGGPRISDAGNSAPQHETAKNPLDRAR